MGTGIRDMIRLGREADLAEPQFDVRDGFVMTFRRPLFVENVVGGEASAQVDARALRVLTHCMDYPLKSAELQVATRIRHRESFQRNYLDFLLREVLIERTIPDKPTHPLQKYRITRKRRVLLERQKDLR